MTDNLKFGYKCAIAGLDLMINYKFAQKFIESKDVVTSVNHLIELSNALSKIEVCGAEQQTDLKKQIEYTLIEIAVGNWDQAKEELDKMAVGIVAIKPEQK